MKSILISMIALAVCLAGAQDTNAQYKLLTRGQALPFDTAVAVQIKTYRLETLKMEKADTLIASQKKMIQQLENNVKHSEQLSKVSGSIIEQQGQLIEAKEKHEDRLNIHIEQLQKIAGKKTAWYVSPPFWGIVGLIVGVFIAK